MSAIEKIHHVAVLVEDMEKALSFWRDALGLALHELRDVPAEQSQVAFLPLQGAEVELVMPTSAESGIAKYLAKRGPGMHHICFQVENLGEILARLKAQGVRLINEAPRTTADGRQYAFIHPESTGGVLVELYE